MQFMIPILGAQILQAMYGAVDMLVVGHFETNAAISGVSTGSSIMNLVTFVLSQLAAGVMILIGRYLGQRQSERIGTLIGRAIAFFLAVSVVLTAALVIFAKPIAVLMQAPAEAVELTAQYIRICGVGCVFVVFYNLISCIFRGLGNSRLPLLFVGIACVVNIVGDLALVALLDMNVAGAAIATIAAQAVSVLLSLIIIRRQKLPFRFSRKDIRLDREVAGFVRVGAPLALQELLTNISFLAICAFINRLGLDASNGYGIAQKIQSFVMLVPSSIMQCMASFVAQNVGAGKEERAKKGMLYGMAVGAGIGVVIAALALFRGDLLASLFSGNAQDIARTFEYLRGFAPEAVLTSVLFSFLGYFNGHSRSTFVMVQSIAQAFLIRLHVSYLMSIQPGVSLTGVGLAVPLSTVFGIAMCLWYYRRMRREYPRARQGWPSRYSCHRSIKQSSSSATVMSSSSWPGLSPSQASYMYSNASSSSYSTGFPGSSVPVRRLKCRSYSIMSPMIRGRRGARLPKALRSRPSRIYCRAASLSRFFIMGPPF